jgi:hypothetical protein
MLKICQHTGLVTLSHYGPTQVLALDTAGHFFPYAISRSLSLFFANAAPLKCGVGCPMANCRSSCLKRNQGPFIRIFDFSNSTQSIEDDLLCNQIMPESPHKSFDPSYLPKDVLHRCERALCITTYQWLKIRET